MEGNISELKKNIDTLINRYIELKEKFNHSLLEIDEKNKHIEKLKQAINDISVQENTEKQTEKDIEFIKKHNNDMKKLLKESESEINSVLTWMTTNPYPKKDE